MPFNPITLEYEQSAQGQKLMDRDEEAKVWFCLRNKTNYYIRLERIWEQLILMPDLTVVTMS